VTAPDPKFGRVWGNVFLAQGLKQEAAGSPAVARRHYLEAADAYAEDDPISRAHALARAGRLEVHPLPGRTAHALARLEEASRLLQADGDTRSPVPYACRQLPLFERIEPGGRREALKLHTLGVIKRAAGLAHSVGGRYDVAQSELRDAAAIFHDLEVTPADEAEATSLLGISLVYAGAHAQAASAFDRARSLFVRAGLPAEAARVRGQSSGLLARTGHRESALEALDEALATPGLPDYTKANFIYQRALNRERLEGIEAALPDYAAACERLWATSAALTAPKLRADYLLDPRRAQIPETAVTKFLRAAHLDPAHARRAFEIHATHKGKVFSDQRLRRRLQRERRTDPETRHEERAARRRWQELEERVTPLRRRLEELDRALADLYRGSETPEADLLVERRGLLAELERLELDAQTHAPFEVAAPAPTLEGVLEGLPPGGCYLEVAPLKHLLAVFLASRALPNGGLAVFVLVDAGTSKARLQRVGPGAPCPPRADLRAGPRWLETAVTQWHTLVAEAQAQVESGQDPRALYEDLGLLEQLDAALLPDVFYEALKAPGPHELVVGADARLPFPFALLRRDGAYLIEKVAAVSLAYAATQISDPEAPPAPAVSPESKVRFFVAGSDPAARELSLRDLEVVLARCQKVILYSGDEATRDLRLEDDVALIHVAAEHGVVEEYSGYSRLVLGGEPGELTSLSVSDLMEMDLPPALVVLAACTTLCQASAPGQMDLGQGLLVAGCSEVLGSYHSIHASDRHFARAFLSELLGRRRVCARHALADAQRRLLRDRVYGWTWSAWGVTFARPLTSN